MAATAGSTGTRKHRPSRSAAGVQSRPPGDGPKHHIAARIRKLRAQLRKRGVGGVLVADELNVRYLTGFTGDSSYLAVTPQRCLLVSDSRYTIQIEEECPDLEVNIRTARTDLLDQLAMVVKGLQVGSLAIETDTITQSFYERLSEKLSAVELVACPGLILSLRAVKDKQEIAAIRESVRIAQRAFDAIRANLRGDQTELQISHDLEHAIRRFGGSGCSFDPIVGVGPRGALPHGRPSPTTLDHDPFVLIDWGARYQGYASDLTRVLVTGRVTQKLRRIYDIVLKAQLAAISKIRPHAALKSIDTAARKVIDDAGFGKSFGHGTGHGFGLQIHELPRLSPIAQGELEPGMVVTVEPGIYLPDWGGVRIEDDVLVTRDGHEVLTSTPKQLDECLVEI